VEKYFGITTGMNQKSLFCKLIQGFKRYSRCKVGEDGIVLFSSRENWIIIERVKRGGRDSIRERMRSTSNEYNVGF
jgi:hypothetical protein